MSETYWIPPMSDKGVDVFNNYSRFLLVHGARRTGKTIALADKVIRHMYENSGAVVGIVARTLRSGEQGVWGDLVRPVSGRLAVWSAGCSLEIVKEPSSYSTTKVSYFRIKSADGGISECQLHSLEHDEEVEAKFKGAKFSMVQMVEADLFKDRMVFKTLTQTLRLINFPSQQFILDTNPPKEGREHWLYDEFFVQPTKHHHEIKIRIEDNPFLSVEEKEELFNLYKDDSNLLARYYYSEWVEARNEGTVFEEVYKKDVHVIATSRPSHEDESEWEILCPEKDCFTIHTGWDIGDKSSAFSMIAPRVSDDSLAFDCIDEVVWLEEENKSLKEFTEEVEESMNFWERRMREMYGKKQLIWYHWSDSSSMSESMAIGGTEANLVYKLSNKRISLRPVTKGAGSVAARRRLLHRLLFEERIYVASHCTHTVDMLEKLPPGTGASGISATSKHKHVFDSLTYGLSSAVPSEMVRKNSPTATSSSGAVSILL